MPRRLCALGVSWSSEHMSEIFISYRRDDSAGHAGRIRDRLTPVFGEKNVFMDVEDIQPGEVFPNVLADRLTGCKVAIIVIGRRWLELLRSRAGGDADCVEAEIGAALKGSAVVIPVLVQGASMPKTNELPNALSELGERARLEVRDSYFDEDAARLLNAVKGIPGVRRRQPSLDLTGTWIARMEGRGQKPWHMYLHFEVFGDSLYGSVEYPTGEGGIQDGRLDGDRFSFRTTHLPNFQTKPATTQIEGEIVGEELRLILGSESGAHKGLASRKVNAT